MVLSIIFLEDKHNILLHLSIFYEYQQVFSTPYLFLDTAQLQLVNLYRNRRYFVIKLHTWFCLSYFLKTNITFYSIYQYFMSIKSFFQHRICFSIQPPDYSDPWPKLEELAPIFTTMYQHSIDTGELPQDWLNANISCIYTRVDTEMCCPKGKCGCQYFILLTL